MLKEYDGTILQGLGLCGSICSFCFCNWIADFLIKNRKIQNISKGEWFFIGIMIIETIVAFFPFFELIIFLIF